MKRGLCWEEAVISGTNYGVVRIRENEINLFISVQHCQAPGTELVLEVRQRLQYSLTCKKPMDQEPWHRRR